MSLTRKILLTVSGCVFVAALSLAQTSSNSEESRGTGIDDSMKGWKPVCVLPYCNPGGQGIPIKTSHTINHKSPTKDGRAMKVSITGQRYTNALWTHVAGHEDKARSMSMSLWVYPTGKTSAAGAYEYDLFNFSRSTGTEFMWGSQCNLVNHRWQIWDQLHGRWMNTPVRCSLAPNRWHSIRWDVHRVHGDTDRCSGQPCMYYDTLTVDHHVHAVNARYPAGPLPQGWSSAVGFQVQIDIGLTKAPVTIDEYIDLADFDAM